MIFEQAMWRFATSGTLILCYGIADRLARRGAGVRRSSPTPRWLAPLALASITAFYLLIGPTGQALFGGWGNGLGIGLAAAAMALRFSRAIRYPDLAGRALFYVALPLAVGVAWGFVVLSLPAFAASLQRCRQEDRFRDLTGGVVPDVRHRMVPGVW